MVFLTEEYTLREKLNYVKASDYSMQFLWPEVIRANLYKEIDSMQVPVIVLQGRYDYQTPYPVAKDFFQQLKAPSKHFFTFEQSAHSPNMEEASRFNEIVSNAAKQYGTN
jgi:pimeloyl-ACP methyl ester carboxylesterase